MNAYHILLCVVIKIAVRTLGKIKVVLSTAFGAGTLRKLRIGIPCGLLRCIELHLAALGTKIDVQFQGASQQIGNIAQDPSRLTQLNLLPHAESHGCAAAQTLQRSHSAFSNFDAGITIGNAINGLARKCLTLSLFFIGASLTRQTLMSVGLKPMLQGVILWIIISLVTLAYILL